MKAQITIAMDNSAFEDMGIELARILRNIANEVENKGEESLAYSGWNLRDVNGNTVGHIKIGD